MQLCSQGGQGQDGMGDSRQNSASSSSLSEIPVPGAQDRGGVGGQCLLVTVLSRPYSPELGCLLAGRGSGFVCLYIPWLSAWLMLLECMETHFSCPSPYFLFHLCLRGVEARAGVRRGQVAGLSVVYSELLRYLHSFSLGHVETKHSPSQDYENLRELSSPDVGEGRVGQDTTVALVRASTAQGWRRTTGVQTQHSRFFSLSLFPGSQGSRHLGLRAEQRQVPQSEPRPES